MGNVFAVLPLRGVPDELGRDPFYQRPEVGACRFSRFHVLIDSLIGTRFTPLARRNSPTWAPSMSPPSIGSGCVRSGIPNFANTRLTPVIFHTILTASSRVRYRSTRSRPMVAPEMLLSCVLDRNQNGVRVVSPIRLVDRHDLPPLAYCDGSPGPLVIVYAPRRVVVDDLVHFSGQRFPPVSNVC